MGSRFALDLLNRSGKALAKMIPNLMTIFPGPSNAWRMPKAACLCLLVAAGVVSTPVLQGQTCVPPPSGLVSWWRGDGDATDSAGSNNGSLQGGISFAAGMVGPAFSLNGVDGFVQIPDDPSLNFTGTSPMTAELWAYRTGTQPIMCFLGKRDPNCGASWEYQMAFDPNNGMHFNSDDGGFSSSGVFTHVQMPLNVWMHLAATFDGATFQFYTNGVLVAAATGTLGPLNTDPLTIGTSGGCANFEGMIDEVSLYNRALSATEIQAIYAAQAAGKCAPPSGPSIITQPAGQSAFVGDDVSLTVLSAGSFPLSYQWIMGGTNLPEATNASLLLTNIQLVNAGTYSVVVSNANGSVASSDAEITVSVPVCTPPPSGLIAWWAGESNANDNISGLSGTLQSGVSFVTGEVGQAFSFNGTNGSVQIADEPNLDYTGTSHLTVELWARATKAQNSFAILGKRTDDCSSWEYQMAFDSNNGLLFNSSSGGGVFTQLPMPLNTWVHLAATFDGSTFSFYTNGNLAAIGTGSLGTLNSAPLTIGASGSCSTFAGLVDEVSLYNRALSATEIQSIYNARSEGKCGSPPGLTAQPQGGAIVADQDFALMVAAVGSNPLRYQWQLNGTNLAGATGSALLLTNVQPANAGAYSVLVSNLYGFAASSNAVVTVMPAVCIPAASNLIGWWAGEGNADDNLGTNNGALQGGVSFGPGRTGLAFRFDGTNGSVQIPNASNLNFAGASPMTVELWAYRTGTQAIMCFVGKRGANCGSSWEYQMAFDPNNGLHFNSSSGGVYTGLQMPLNTWMHLAATFDGTTFSFYTNGILAAIGSGSLGPSNSVPLTIGTSGGCPYFAGLIDEVCLYSRALSPAEVQAVYLTQAAGKCGFPPVMLNQPQGVTAQAGSNVTLTASAKASHPLIYQWQLNGIPVAGGTNSSLTISNIQPSNAGNYSLAVTNALGSAQSSNALLKVVVISLFANGQLLTNAQYSFSLGATIQIQNYFTNGPVFYTLDGSMPSFASAQYTDPFLITNSVVLRALAYSADFFQSSLSDPVAVVILPNFMLTATTSGGGVVLKNPSAGLYASNSFVTVTATPAAGWTFLQWMGDAGGANPTNTVVMNRAKSIQAIFGTTLNTSAAGGGSVVLNPPGGVYPYGTTVQLTPVPQAGQRFALWGSAASGSANPLSFLLTNANPTVSSLFASLSAGQVALAIIPSGHGQVSLNPSANVYSNGQTVAVTAIPNSGQSFLGWSGDATGGQNPLSVSMNRSKTIYANFSGNNNLSLQLQPAGLTEGLQLNLNGDFGKVYRLDASSDLTNWTTLFTLTNSVGTIHYLDYSVTNFTRRFYRGVALP